MKKGVSSAAHTRSRIILSAPPPPGYPPPSRGSPPLNRMAKLTVIYIVMIKFRHLWHLICSALSESKLSNPSPSPSHHLWVRVITAKSESESSPQIPSPSPSPRVRVKKVFKSESLQFLRHNSHSIGGESGSSSWMARSAHRMCGIMPISMNRPIVHRIRYF